VIFNLFILKIEMKCELWMILYYKCHENDAMNLDARIGLNASLHTNAKHMGVVSDALNLDAPKVPKVRLINA
jgi:hypothetical protein